MINVDSPRSLMKGEIVTETFIVKKGTVKLEMAFRVLEVDGNEAKAQVIGVTRTNLITGEVTERTEGDDVRFGE